MAQVTNYPLPPLFLTEILEKAKADHTHKCDDFCIEEDGARYCQSSRDDNEGLLDVPVIIKIEPGYGRHIHDDPDDESGCSFYEYESYDEYTRSYVKTRRRKPFDGCMEHCDDSDWIVTLRYHSRGWQAVYGIKRAGDVQDVSLWMD